MGSAEQVWCGPAVRCGDGGRGARQWDPSSVPGAGRAEGPCAPVIWVTAGRCQRFDQEVTIGRAGVPNAETVKETQSSFHHN